MAMDKIKVQITLLVLLAVLGLLLSVKFTNEGYYGYLEHQNQEDLLAIWRDLETKKDSLEEEVEAVQEKKRALTQEASADSTALSNIQEQRDTVYQFNGLVHVKGPGINIVFSGDTPLLYLDLVDIVNELWASGAEAVAVNQERVTASTSFYFTETASGIFLTVNGHRVNYPLTIKAIGNPNMLEKGLTFPGGIVDNLSTLYNIKPEIKKAKELELPARETSRLDMISGWVQGSRNLPSVLDPSRNN